MRSYRETVADPRAFRALPEHEIAGRAFGAAEIVSLLAPFLSDERRQRIANVVANRTRNIVPVLEGLYDRGNVSAVLRSAEALGYQDVHIIDNSPNIKHARRVTQGAEKWLDVHEWFEPGDCVAALRAQGFTIAVAHLGGGVTVRELDPSRRTAIVFGNEHTGPSEEMLALADVAFEIPMSGFVESFNISVAAALCFYDFRERRNALPGGHGDMSAQEQVELCAAFHLRGLEHAEKILSRFR